MTTFHGIFSANHKARPALAQLVPKPLPEPKPATDDADEEGDSAQREKVPPPYRHKWAELLKATFGFDFLNCPKCASKMRAVASLTDPDSIKTYLTGTGLWEEPYPIAPARAPPQLSFDDTFDCADEGAFAEMD